ncbi:FadR/GntR family transcriptional regulator [Micropruina sp.]|uniref:FadR/GntR family transcriptional regulator n=1 Tax=Micropruina sp. TaxID=2737536 RepID=UPI0039E563D8
MASAQLHHAALDEIGQEIVDGVRPVGSVLTLADLEQRFVVSRTVAREIMRILEALGMVRSRRRVGITIRPRSSWNVLDPLVVRWRLAGAEHDRVLLDVTELRASLQPMAAELAARNATPEQRQRLSELADEIVRTSRQPEKASAMAEAELDFNTLLLRATANELFFGFSGMVRLVQRLDGPAGVEPGLVWAERYRRIAGAVAAGDAETARIASRAQVAQGLAAMATRVGPRPTLTEPPSTDDWSV